MTTICDIYMGMRVVNDRVRDIHWCPDRTGGTDHWYTVTEWRPSVHGMANLELVEKSRTLPKIDRPVNPDPDKLIGTCHVPMWLQRGLGTYGSLVPARVYQRPSDRPADRGEIIVYDGVIDVDGVPGRIIDGYRLYPPELTHWHAPMFWDESAQALTNDLFAVLVPV